MVLSGALNEEVLAELSEFLRDLNIEVVPFGHGQALTAIQAFRRYGKGRHPAGLNFGDCMTYALAKHFGQPLLCKGTDFSRTDLTLA